MSPKHVRFDGTLPNRGLITAFGEADALVLPSVPEGNWTETQGAVVQEALLMKAVVVTTRTGGMPESIPSMMRPFSVPPGDTETLAGAIARVFHLSRAELEGLGEQGRISAAQHYDIARLNEQLLSQVFAE